MNQLGCGGAGKEPTTANISSLVAAKSTANSFDLNNELLDRLFLYVRDDVEQKYKGWTATSNKDQRALLTDEPDILVKDFEYLSNFLSAPPSPGQVKVYPLANYTDDISKRDVEFTDTYVNTWSVSVKQGLTTSLNVKGGYKSPMGFSGEVGLTITQSMETLQTKSDSHTTTWKVSDHFDVKPHTKKTATYTINEVSNSVDWRATIRLKGYASATYDVYIHMGQWSADINESKSRHPVGELFKRVPHPMVQVIGPDEVEILATGTFTGVARNELPVQITEEKL